MSLQKKITSKIVSDSALQVQLEVWKAAGDQIVFTNGVYDIIHRGHITLLEKAASLGSRLVLGLNSDASVRTLGKGPDRPINLEADRAFVLAALQMVDAVVIFNDHTPFELIKSIKPDVLVKGGDYNAEQTDASAKDYIVGSDLQRADGRKTTVIPIVDGYSTTATAKKLADGKN